MNHIDTSSWKEFKLGNILQKVDTRKILLKKSECSPIRTEEYNLPARTATAQNHGLSCYVPRDCATVLKDCISVSANGDYCAFWHDSEFTILQDSYALQGNGFKLTEKISLFLISCMDRAFSSKYNWNNKSGWEKLRNETIKLPVTESEEIDWNYMQERITELEQERITELEQYLIATGLNDYTLTEEDEKILSMKLTDDHEKLMSGDGCWKEAKEFRVGDLFETQKVMHKLSKEKLSNIYTYPAYSSDTSNGGIIGYTNKPEFICNSKVPTYVTFGDHTRTFNIAKKSFSVLDNVKVLKPCFNNDNALLYITSVWRKSIPNLGYSRHWKIAKDCVLEIPIQTDVNNAPIMDFDRNYHPNGYIPDWDFMERYIKAIEKVVIKDVVEWKDAVIEKTKEVVA